MERLTVFFLRVMRVVRYEPVGKRRDAQPSINCDAWRGRV